ncbi:uncharacterized protein LOC110537462 isoform X1 [Oncorhynchus mykiss]|uniref:uncharacterized protein LOC110537462 isoform X1 n=1 Tax=Oncorhynchus mykiss TaxID=8022 RepID=UPI0018788ED3|nr:uncharacterized protein LOC110537462 isoform X1 [Oncorhynchus mykiss]
MVHEMMKENRDLPLINQHMQKTFALRHQEIVQSSPTVEHLRTRWPALFLEAQVHAEFQRITNQSLQQTFYSALDHHTPRLLTLFREEEGKSTTHEGKFSSILRVYNEQVSGIHFIRDGQSWCGCRLLFQPSSDTPGSLDQLIFNQYFVYCLVGTKSCSHTCFLCIRLATHVLHGHVLQLLAVTGTRLDYSYVAVDERNLLDYLNAK